MANLPTQNDAAVNYHADSAATGTPVTGPGSHASAAAVFVSGTAQQVDTRKDNYLYINVTNAAAVLAVAIGPTAATAITISASQLNALGVITVFVPAGWYVKLTGTMANVTNVVVPV